MLCWCCCGVSAGSKLDENLPVNAIVSSDGSVLWMYPALIQTYCALNVEYFPFDAQNCQFIFVSWTYSGLELNISISKDFKNSVYYKSENQVCFAPFNLSQFYLFSRVIDSLSLR